MNRYAHCNFQFRRHPTARYLAFVGLMRQVLSHHRSEFASLLSAWRHWSASCARSRSDAYTSVFRLFDSGEWASRAGLSGKHLGAYLTNP
jgi:hypothetical protein